MEKVESQLGFRNADGDDTTANQAYKDAQAKGFKGSFAQFLAQYGNKGYLNSAIDTLGKIKSLFGADTTTPTPSTETYTGPEAVSPTTILGMPKPVAIIVGIAVVGLIGYGIYRAVK